MNTKAIGIFKTKKQMYNYLAMLKSVAMADNQYSACEDEFIRGVLTTLKSHYPQEEVDVLFDAKKWDRVGMINKVFGEDTKIAREVLLNCIIVAHIDGTYSKSEKGLVEKYAEELNVDISVVRQMEKLIRKQFQANLELQAVIEGGK